MTGNGLPPAALQRLRDALAPGGHVVRVRPLRGGISSSVHLVRLGAAGGQRQAVVVRRYGAYWLERDPAACEREFRLLEALERLSFPAPRPILLDTRQGGPFGAPTVVMSRVAGRPLLAPRDVHAYIEQIARMLVDLHRLPIDGLEFVRDQRDVMARTLGEGPPKADDPLQQAVWSALLADWPRVSRGFHRRTLLHGDYWPGNMLWSRGRLVGLVDWEQPLLGDPARDVATCRGDLTIMFGPQAGAEFLTAYKVLVGEPIENLRFWDLLISTWAVREIHEWAVVYPLLSRPDLTPELCAARIREFASAALARSDES